jgi:hypothetical protein
VGLAFVNVRDEKLDDGEEHVGAEGNLLLFWEKSNG